MSEKSSSMANMMGKTFIIERMMTSTKEFKKDKKNGKGFTTGSIDMRVQYSFLIMNIIYILTSLSDKIQLI